MAAAAPAAPLLAFGPPGWLAYVVVVGGSAIVAGVVINEMTKDDTWTTSTTTTTTNTARQTCKIPYTVRVHAQGSDIKTGSNAGTRKATIGGVPVIHPSVPITVSMALGVSTVTWLLLEKKQAAIRISAKAKLEKWVAKLPPYGYLGEQSFEVRPPKKKVAGARYDIDSLGCTPNMIR